MPITFVASTKFGGTTSAGINTTGASLLVAYVSHYGAETLSDSYSNTWTTLTNQISNLNGAIRFVANPVVGAGHTFTIGSSGGVCVAAFAGVQTASPVDTQNGAATASGVTSWGSGTTTPSGNGRLFVHGIAMDGAVSAVGIGSGFTLAEDLDAAGAYFETKLAYFIQTTSAGLNPLWSWTSARAVVCSVATFKPADGGGASSQIKEINGIGWAAVKEINGIAVAGVKSINGVSVT